MICNFNLFVLILFACPLFSQTPTAQKLDPNMAIGNTDVDDMIWFDPREEPFHLVGFEWMEQDTVYRRLPISPKWQIPVAVDHLANQTAGGQVRFRTNSGRIVVKVKLAEKSGMYHMPATGQSGFDLYVREGGEYRYLKTTRFSSESIDYEAELLKSSNTALKEYTINFPLYNGVESLRIGLENGATLEPHEPFTFRRKFVIYGTSITQGGCVSRPGSAYSNMLSRQLDAEFINLGFSGNGKGEPELAHLINQIGNIGFIILDYEANANETIKNTLEAFLDTLRKENPRTPILIMSKIRYAAAREGSESYRLLMENRDFQEELVARKRDAGDNNLYFLDGSRVLGEDYYECTVDGGHPTDLGSYRIGKALLTKIRDILKS